MKYLGTVVRGQQLGGKLGFPTANMKLEGAPPPDGVWIVSVKGLGLGVCNVGKRPTVGGVGLVVEIHVLDFSGDLYGAELEFETVSRLRDEKKFASLDELKAQIALDIAAARRYNSVMPEGNMLGRLTALAILIAAVVWVNRFTGGAAMCSFCPDSHGSKSEAAAPAAPAEKAPAKAAEKSPAPTH